MNDIEILPAETPPTESRTQQAMRAHTDVVRCVEELSRKWYRLTEAVRPIDEHRLYKELGFSSFKDYCEQVVRKPVSTVRNGLYLTKAIEAAGLDPAELDDIQASRVSDLVAVAKAGADAETFASLVEDARTAKSRSEITEFKDAVRSTLKEKGVDYEIWVRVQCATEAQKQFIKDTIAEQSTDPALEGKAVSEAEALALICASWWTVRRAR